MSEFGVTEEAIAQLQGLASSLGEVKEKLNGEYTKLNSAYEDNKDGLGSHSESIHLLIEDLQEPLAEISKNIQGLSAKCLKAAVVRKIHIQEKRYKEETGEDFVKAGFERNVSGLKATMDLGSGDSSVKQLGGIHKEVRKQDGPGYESHHIPSAAALKEYGVNTNEWPTLAILKEDHKMTDSYTYKQRQKHKPLFGDTPPGGTYKQETVEMLATPGGFFDLIRDEIYNIKDKCGDKYDGAIAQYLDAVSEYVKKHGVPEKKNL